MTNLSYLRPKKKAEWKSLTELAIRRLTESSEWETHAREVHGWGEAGTLPREAHREMRQCNQCIEHQRRLVESEEWK